MCPYDHGEDRIVVEPGQSNAEGFGGPRVTVVERRESCSLFCHASLGTNFSQLREFFPGSDAVDTSKVGAVDQEMQDATVEPISPPRMPMRGRGGFAGRGGHQGRAGFTAALAGQPRSNTILVVEKIPDEFCNLDKVNEFFKKFGTITNIQVDRYQHKATVQFSNQHEARQAYSSPDAVFGNRFVKVFYMALESARAQGPGNAGPMDAASEGPTKLAPEPAKPTLTPEEQKEREAKLKEILEQEEKLKKEALQAKILLAKRQAQEALARQAAEGTPKSIKELLEEKERARLDRDLDMLAAGGEQGDQGLKQMLESKVAELQAEVGITRIHSL